jgi:hypothetical protein
MLSRCVRESRPDSGRGGSILRKLLLSCLLALSAATLAASDDDFYQRLYQRGMTHFAAADYAQAFTQLRTAAFGFVENIEQFDVAHAYASIAAHRLGHDSDARDSLIRIVNAERAQPRYRSMKLSDELRAELNTIAANLLTREEAAVLGITAAAKRAVDIPTPSKRPNVAVTAPRNGGPDAGAPPQPAVGNVESSLADAQRAIDSGDTDRARSIYTALAGASSLPHDAALRVAAGLNRVRDFAGAAQAFARAGTIGTGEEHYRYDYAVALYETGHIREAKRELAAALPHITMTPDVTRYRTKIEAAIE